MASFADVSAALKIVYPWKEMMRDWYENQPGLAWIPKRTDFYGRSMSVSISYSPGGGISHTFSSAQANEDNPNSYAEFTGITRAKSYGLIYLDGEAMEASEGGKNASYLSTKKDHIQGVLSGLSQEAGHEIWGDGVGDIGAVTIAGNVLTLTDADTVTRCNIGMQLQAVSAANRLTGPLRGAPAGQYCTITAIDEDAGTVTVDNAAAIAGFVSTDIIVPRGNHLAAMQGIGTYISNAAAPAALWGVTRTTHRRRLAGHYYNHSTMSPSEALSQAMAKAARAGTKPDVWWVNNTQFLNIDLDLGAKATREHVKIGEWGYDSLRTTFAGHQMRIMADHNLPTNTAYGLTRKTWCLHTLKKMPRFLTYGAGKDIVKPTDDGLELRLGWRGQLVCRAPGKNIRVLMPT